MFVKQELKAQSQGQCHRVKVKVTGSNILVWLERSWHKEDTCQVWKPSIKWLRFCATQTHRRGKIYMPPTTDYGAGCKGNANAITRVTHRVKVNATGSNILVWLERSWNKKYTCQVWNPCIKWFQWYTQGSSTHKVFNIPLNMYIQYKGYWILIFS